MKPGGENRKFVGLAFIVLVMASLPAARAADAVNLRGYGKVSAELTPDRAVFHCESVPKADILLDKLEADLFWDEAYPAKSADVKVGGSTVTVYSLPGYGSAAIARSGANVVVLGAADETRAAALAAGERLLLGSDVTSHAAKRHPVSLDYYDNRAFKTYIQAMTSRWGYGIETHWPFMKSIKSCAAFFGPMFHNACPAPGVINWTSTDYEVREAERQNEMVVIGPNGGGESPFWVQNACPDSLMKPSDTTLLGDWGGVGMDGAHYESWCIPMEERSQLGLGFLQKTMERYRSSPAVGGWMLFAGSPGVEYNFHGIAMHTWDTSPTGQAGWRRWLKEERHYSLADVGTRWYGDASHFANWEQVTVPDLNEFYGAYGVDTFALSTGWRWQNAPVLASTPPDAEGAGWIAVAMPPSQQQAFIPRQGINYFDITIDPTDWLKQQKAGAGVWLVFGMIGTAREAEHIWLNDKALTIPKDEPSRSGSFTINITGLLKPGANHLQVAMDCSVHQACGGKLAGPVFLTAREPQRAPYLGRLANARHSDLVEWQSWAMTDYHRQLLRLARKLDPDRPYVLSGGAGNIFDYAVELAADYGMGIENTGREASYRPHLSGEGLAAGFYSTSEWSATPSGEFLDRGFGWMVYDVDSSHCLYHNIEDCQKRDKEDGWYTKHIRQFELFGKCMREQPKVALLLSGETVRLNGRDPHWDLGLGQLPGAHYESAYVTEKGVKDGLAARYPLLIDTGSEFMEPDVVAAVGKYVEQGGTFVAMQNTAMHTALEPDSRPLAELSGFRVTAKTRGGKLQFQSHLPILSSWQGKAFGGSGMMIEQVNPADASAIPLACWSDGAIAVGYRKIGNGQIITLGSSFWREGKDPTGVWRDSHELERHFIERLFTDCGIARTSTASIPEVWTRRTVTKNGLQNWLLALNSTGEPIDADVWMQTDSKPEEVINLESNAAVPFVYENHGVLLKDIHFEKYEIKHFAVRRAALAAGLPIWWGEKTTYWNRTPAEIASADMTLPTPKHDLGENLIRFDKWRFQTDGDHASATKGDWNSVSFDDRRWAEKEPGAWNLFDPALKDYHGSALYRAKFDVPSGWDGRRILLNLFDWDTPIVFDVGDFYINGVKVATYKKRGWSQTFNYDVTAQIHPGENVLAIEVAGGPKYGGLSGIVWIESRMPLAPSMDLGGAWQAVKGDRLTHVDVTIPPLGGKLKTKAKCLTRTASIPANWAGRNMFVEWETKTQWVACIAVNGHPICYNAAVHPFGLMTRVNVTQYLKPGEENVIEIWPLNTLPSSDGPDIKEVGGIEFDSIRIGCQ